MARTKPRGPLGAADRRRLVADYLAAHPPLSALVRDRYPGTYQAARVAGCGVEDIAQAAALGVVRAAELFDPARGVKFGTFADPWVRAGVQKLFRRAAVAYRRGVVTHSLYACRPDGLTPLEAVAARESGGGSSPETLVPLVRAVLERRVADPVGRRVAELRWGLTGRGVVTLREVGEEIGRSRERVRQIESAAIAACRDDLADLLGG